MPARRATVPVRMAGGPKAERPVVPHGCAGLVFDSMTSPTSTMASGWRPVIVVPLRGSRPSRMDSPRRSSLTRPGSSSPSAQARLAEFPPEIRSSRRSNLVSSAAAMRDSSAMLCRSGITPLWHARLVPTPINRRWRLRSVACTSSCELVLEGALAQVAELDHHDHVVHSAAIACRATERVDDVTLAVEAGRGPLDHGLDLAEHRSPDEGQWRDDPGVAHARQVLDARVTESGDAAARASPGRCPDRRGSPW